MKEKLAVVLKKIQVSNQGPSWPSFFDELFYTGILKVSKLEIVDGMLNRCRSVSIRGNSYYFVSDRSYSY